MTDSEWLACPDPTRMLESAAATSSNRKLWLFVAAACRHATSFIPDAVVARVAGVSRRLAEEGATSRERNTAWQGLQEWKERLVAEQHFYPAAVVREVQDLLAAPNAEGQAGQVARRVHLLSRLMHPGGQDQPVAVGTVGHLGCGEGRAGGRSAFGLESAVGQSNPLYLGHEMAEPDGHGR